MPNDYTRIQIKELFYYSNGHLYWNNPLKHKPRNGNLLTGNKVGYKNKLRGYITVNLDKKTTYLHRLIWIYHNGQIPDGLIVDHINHKRHDNRIENLRLITRSQNSAGYNRKNKNHGVNYKKRDKRWVFSVTIDKKSICHYFKNKKDAIKKRDEVYKKLRGI